MILASTQGTYRFDGPGGHPQTSLRYDEDTEFLEADRPVVPSSRLVGMKAHIIYKKSLFAGDRTIKVIMVK